MHVIPDYFHITSLSWAGDVIEGNIGLIIFNPIPSTILKWFALMMEAVCISETSVCFSESTWHHIPEG
jgi:hypothetical protein